MDSNSFSIHLHQRWQGHQHQHRRFTSFAFSREHLVVFLYEYALFFLTVCSLFYSYKRVYIETSQDKMFLLSSVFLVVSVRLVYF